MHMSANGSDQGKSARAFAEERRRAIVTMLETAASVQVADLARAFGVSAVTVRGDLDALAADGKLRRTHGGAVSLDRALTVSVQDKRVNVNAAAKRSIARAALAFVRDGDTIAVDSGTTALELVRALGTRTGVTVTTADITIANCIDESLPGVDAVLLGGTLRKGHRYLYGPIALKSLEAIHADLTFVCPGALIPARGLMTDFPQMAELKRALMASAEKVVALVDASKVGGRGTYRFADLTDVDALVMDADPDGAVAKALDGMADGERRPDLVLTEG